MYKPFQLRVQDSPGDRGREPNILANFPQKPEWKRRKLDPPEGGGAHISGAPLDLALNRLLNSLYF